MGGDVGEQAVEGIGGEQAAVLAAGVGADAGAGEAEHGGEGDQVRVDAGEGAGAGGDGGDHVVHEKECPCFLAGQGLGLAAQHAAGAAEGLLQVEERYFSQPPLIPVKKKSSLAFRVHPGRY